MLCPNCTKELDRPWISSRGEVYCPICHKNFANVSNAAKGIGKDDSEKDYRMAKIAYGRWLEYISGKNTERLEDIDVNRYLEVTIERCMKAKSAGHTGALLFMGYLYEKGYLSTTSVDISRKIAKDIYNKVILECTDINSPIRQQAQRYISDIEATGDRYNDVFNVKPLDTLEAQLEAAIDPKKRYRSPLFILAKFEPTDSYELMKKVFDTYGNAVVWFEKEEDSESYERMTYKNMEAHFDEVNPTPFFAKDGIEAPIYMFFFNKKNYDKEIIVDRKIIKNIEKIFGKDYLEIVSLITELNERRTDQKSGVYTFFADDIRIAEYRDNPKKKSKINENRLLSIFEESLGIKDAE